MTQKFHSGVSSREVKMYTCRKADVRILEAGFFTIVPNCKYAGYPRTEKWIKPQVHSYRGIVLRSNN